ncbi:MULTISPECIES: hypothetical protein [unclassified Microcoleus]|uniref:hypothetical protein n=1 Tax=unclassified Microcoleus TaxID=2642155 RepID=UPI0025FB4000|nr:MULTISPECIES: hypothetical protein [unclassified Microcoleus]
MTISSSQKQGREEQAISSTTLLTDRQRKNPNTPVRMFAPTPSLQKIWADHKNADVRKNYPLYRPMQGDISSIIYAGQLKDIDEEKVRDSTHEIAVYNLAQSVPQERRGRFLSPRITGSSNNLPCIHKKSEATKHQRQRCQGLRLYLDSLKNEVREARDANFSERVLNLSWYVWNALKSLFEATGRCLEVPDACPGSKDNFMYTWSESEHYLECEIFATGEIEFFYRNRQTGEVWGEDTTLEQGFSADILEKASFFIE